MSVAVEGHCFWLADTADSFYNIGGVARGGTGPTAGNGQGVKPAFDRCVGSELDVVAGWAVARFVQLEGGYAQRFHGDYIGQSDARRERRTASLDFVLVRATLRAQPTRTL